MPKITINNSTPYGCPMPVNAGDVEHSGAQPLTYV